MDSPQLILASGSPYRKELLMRLTSDFTVCAPDVDETPRAGEGVAALVERLARHKARAVAEQFDRALIIASDQSAELDGVILNKPGCFENALEQLMMCCGRTLLFHTGLCVLDSPQQEEMYEDVVVEVKLREFSRQQASDYLHHDQPWDCCGSIRSEGRGIALCEYIRSDDPSTLIGLPLITLTKMLAHAGLEL